MSDKTNFLLDGDIVALTYAEIDEIEQLYVPPGDKKGSQITDDDIEDVLEDKDISGNEKGTTVPSDIPDDFEGPIPNEDVKNVVDDVIN